MSTRLDILWAPIKNRFITWGADISLYEVESLKDNPNSPIKLSNTSGAHLLATNTNHHYVKCIDVYPKSDNDILLALGLANGRVVLSTFGPSYYDIQGLAGKELVPRHPRPCNVVAWNPLEPNKLVCGLEKYRSDHSVLLWDINKCTGSDNGRLNNCIPLNMADSCRPVAEFGLSEATHSLAWFNGNSKVLAAGMNLKSIRIIDFRDSAKVVNSTLTKAVHGICMNPHNDAYVASYIDHQINIWDTRNFEKALISLVVLKPVVKLAWCPTKHNLLGSLLRESTHINLYDIEHCSTNEEIEPSVIERLVSTGSMHHLTSFAWHANDENRFLAIAVTGAITDYTVFDRITLNWASNSNITWTYGRKTIKYMDESSNIHSVLQDVSEKIKQRACTSYGLKDEFAENAQLVDDEMLANVWLWLDLSSKLVEEGNLRGCGTKHPGIKSFLRFDTQPIKSEVVSVPWMELGCLNCHGSAKYYKHEDREKAIHLCGWNFDNKDDSSMYKCFEKFEKDQSYTRAAAIAVFSLNMRVAIGILQRSSDNSLRTFGMALAGFTDDKTSVWRQNSMAYKSRITDPYLKAIFDFLFVENHNYDCIVNDPNLCIEDRIAFACLYLSDNKLFDYLKNIYNKFMEEGNLEGMLLTGNSEDGIKLLQRYMDITGDIQSTTLIAVRVFELNPVIQEWVSCYRNLLDVWKFWHQRARFDILLSKVQQTEKAPQQVYISCNFCGKSISAYMQGLNRSRSQFGRIGSTTMNKHKLSSCPYCRKPLPRCAICLMHMGTMAGDHLEKEIKVAEFGHWFTWCQTCRHGGHSSHMTHWFEQHSECPVTTCSCKCFSVDSINRLNS